MRRFERWVLTGVAALFLASLVFCLWPRDVEAPIKGLGEPTDIVRKRGSMWVSYVVDKPLEEAFTDIDMRLQIKGFSKENNYPWSLRYRRGRSEYIAVDRGVWRRGENDSWWLDLSQPGKTSVAYMVRTPGWWSSWTKAQRNWMAYKQSRSGTSSRRVVRRGPRRLNYPATYRAQRILGGITTP